MKRENTGKNRKRRIWIPAAIAALALAGMAGGLWLRSRALPEEIDGQTAIEQAEPAAEEIPAPAEEPVLAAASEEEAPLSGSGEEIQAPEEEPADEELGAGPEVLGEESQTTAPRAAFAEIFEQAGVEPTYQLAAEAGELGYSVMARGNAMTGISLYEFLYDGEDRVITMAATDYSFFPGATAEELAAIGEQILAESQPPEALDYVTVTEEIAADCVILRIRMEGMDDPAVVAKLSQIAFIPYTAEELLYYTPTRDELVDTIGYALR